MAPRPGLISGRPRRRAVEACTFCRRRKVCHLPPRVVVCTFIRANIFYQIKCNNEHPTCANCKTYGKDCIYEPLSNPCDNAVDAASTPRRTERRRRGALVEARTRLHSQSTDQDGGDKNGPPTEHGDVSSHTPGLGVSVVPAPRDGTHHPDTPADPAPSHRAGISRIVVSANGVSSYHGRTSALFEESLQERTSAVDLRPRMPDDWIEKGLIAEAAKQRMFYHLLHLGAEQPSY